MNCLNLSLFQPFWYGFFLCLLQLNISAQQYNYLDAENFNGIASSGTIPKDFTLTWASRLESNPNVSSGEELEEFWSSQYYLIDDILQSGRIVFNHPATDNLNAIKNELLKDDPVLRDQIRVYVNKNPFANAFAMGDGIIIFNTGILAYANTEAELAFVMAHEIQHYKRKHILQSFRQREALLREKVREYRRLHPLEKMALLTMQSQEHEFDADEQGLELLLQSSYNPNAAFGIMPILHESYMPYGRKTVEHDFLLTAGTGLPHIFFREEVKPISREEDYFDETHAHPNIYKRRFAIDETLKGKQGGTEDFVQPKAQFTALRNLMRFERVRELVLYGYYGDALYDIYCLREDFPESRFLDISEAKALYGMAVFKANRAYDEVARSTSRQEGPVQQVHHIMKQFSKQQLTTYALQFIREVSRKYPEEKYLDIYASELVKFMLLNCEISFKDFEQDVAAQIPSFEGKQEDYRNEREYFRAQQKHYRDFYRYLLRKDIQDGWLQESFSKNQWLRDSLDQHRNMNADDKNDKMEALEEAWEEGQNLHVREIIMLEPTLVLNKSDEDNKDRIKNFEKEMEFKKQLPSLLKESGIEGSLFFSYEIDPNDTERYNDFSRLKEWISEARFFSGHDLIPTSVDITHKLKSFNESRYVCEVRGLVQEGADTYFFMVYDLIKGKVVFYRRDKQGFRLSLNDLLSETAKDLEKIY